MKGSKAALAKSPVTQSQTSSLTTSVLIATILEYAVGAGITAGAGTRLFLQSLLS